jgi:hypothetical protein
MIMSIDLITNTIKMMQMGASAGSNAGEELAKLMAKANKNASEENGPAANRLVKQMCNKQANSDKSDNGDIKLLKAVLALVQKRASGEGSDSGSAKEVVNLLKAILPFINKGKEEDSETSGSKSTKDLLKALAPLIKNGMDREKAAEEDSSGSGVKAVRNFLQALLAMIQMGGEEDEDDSGLDGSGMGNLLKMMLPLLNPMASAGMMGADLGKMLGNMGAGGGSSDGGGVKCATDLMSSISDLIGGKGATSAKKETKSTEASKTDSPAPAAAKPTSGSEGSEKTKSDVKSGMSAAEQAIPLLMDLLKATESSNKGDQLFAGKNLLDILSSKNGDVKLSDAGFAGGKGPGGEFSSEDGAVKIANKDGSNLGTGVEVDLKNLFSNKGDIFNPAKDNINELATLLVKYANGKEEMISATGEQSSRDGNQTVKLGNGKDQIASVEFALPKGAKEGDTSDTRNKSDAGIGAVRLSGSASDPSATAKSILDLLPSILGKGADEKNQAAAA